MVKTIRNDVNNGIRQYLNVCGSLKGIRSIIEKIYFAMTIKALPSVIQRSKTFTNNQKRCTTIKYNVTLMREVDNRSAIVYRKNIFYDDDKSIAVGDPAIENVYKQSETMYNNQI